MGDEATGSGEVGEPSDPIGAFEVLRIVATPDPEVRNHLVTLAYWEMSQTLDGLLHEGFGRGRKRPSNANWFTVATWAISTVGRNIRANELPRRLDQMLPTGLRSQATPWLLSMRSSSGRRVQRALGHGQIVVFTSTMLAALEFVQRHEAQPIGALNRIVEDAGAEGIDPQSRPFRASLYKLEKTRPLAVDNLRQSFLDRNASVQPEHLTELTRPRGRLTAAQKEQLGRLVTSSDAVLDDETEDSDAPSGRQTEGPPPRGSLVTEFLRLLDGDDETQGMDFLRKLVGILVESEDVERDLQAAFEAYQRAREADDARTVAQEIFRANLIIAAVEQVLLDRPVTTVVDHVPREFEDWFELNASVWGERLLRIPRSLGRLGVSRRFRRSQVLIRDAWARLLTDQILVLALPSETLRIGRDIPLRSLDGEFHPYDLACLPRERPVAGPTGSKTDKLSTDELFTLFDRSRGDGVRTGAWDWRRFDERLNFAANLLRSRQQDRTLFWQPYNEEDRERIRNGQVPIRTADAFEQSIVGPTFDWLESSR